MREKASIFFSTCGKMREANLWIRRSVEIMQMQMTRCAFDFFPGKNLFYRSSALRFSWGVACYHHCCHHWSPMLSSLSSQMLSMLSSHCKPQNLTRVHRSYIVFLEMGLGSWDHLENTKRISVDIHQPFQHNFSSRPISSLVSSADLQIHIEHLPGGAPTIVEANSSSFDPQQQLPSGGQVCFWW